MPEIELLQEGGLSQVYKTKPTFSRNQSCKQTIQPGEIFDQIRVVVVTFYSFWVEFSGTSSLETTHNSSIHYIPTPGNDQMSNIIYTLQMFSKLKTLNNC